MLDVLRRVVYQVYGAYLRIAAPAGDAALSMKCCSGGDPLSALCLI